MKRQTLLCTKMVLVCVTIGMLGFANAQEMPASCQWCEKERGRLLRRAEQNEKSYKERQKSCQKTSLAHPACQQNAQQLYDKEKADIKRDRAYVESRCSLHTGTYQTYNRDYDGHTLRPLRTVTLQFQGTQYVLRTPDGIYNLQTTKTPGEFVTTNPELRPPVSMKFVQRNAPSGCDTVQYDVYYRQQGKELKSEVWDLQR